MDGRSLTNVLLAIIAAVLLFGQSAVTGGIQIAMIVGAIGLVLFLVVAGIVAAVRWFASESARIRSSDEPRSEKAMEVIGLVLLPFGGIFLGYAAYLWFQGVARPLQAVMDSWVGTVWTGLLVLVFGTLILTSLPRVWGWLRLNAPVFPIVIGKLLILPVYGTVRTWRQGSESGVVGRIASTTFMAFASTLIWMLGMTFAALVVGGLAGII